MRMSRGLLILAIFAALWGAPSSVSAAVNELSSPEVSPGSGSVTTVFTFRVRYEGGSPAASVDVTVAHLTVPMVLESGSLTAGWWRGVAALPVGAWSTSFRASAVLGPSATVSGPAVTVADTTTLPPATAGPTSPTTKATPESAPVGPISPTAPPAAPAPSPQETADAAAAGATPVPAAPDAEAAPADPDPDAAPAGAGESEVPTGHGSAAMPEPGQTADDDGDAPAVDGAPAAPAASAPVPTGGMARIRPAAASTSGDERAATDELVSDVLLFGLAGVASVAVVGTLLLVAGRRREPERAPAIATPRNAAPSVAKSAALRRIAREDRGRAADDPIIAALGVDDEMAARRAIRRSLRETPDANRHPTRRPRER